MIPFKPERVDEYVLGLLDREEAIRLERLAATNETVARAIAQARDRFAELDYQTPPVAIPYGLSNRIIAGLDADRPHADDGADIAAVAAHGTVWGRVVVPAAAALAALGLGLGIGWHASSIDPTVIAVLQDDAGVPRAIVEDFGGDSARLRFLAVVEVPENRVMQVWTLPSADVGPKSMGLLLNTRVTQLAGFELPEPANDQLYEITLEPEGGSPTGLPTGPILAKGLGAFQTY